MVVKAELRVPLYYNEEKEEWLIDEQDKNLVDTFDKMIDAMNRKYCAVRDGFHSYAFGWLDKELANKIEARYPGEFEPDGDYFDEAIDDDALTGVWSLEDFYEEVISRNFKHLDGAESFEAFKKEVLE